MVRQALLSTTHPWSIYFQEITGLLGLPGPVSGAGTAANPWVADISTAGPLSVRLAAWNAQNSGNATDPQLLRLCLQLAANGTGSQVTWTTELLSADLPASGSNQVRLLGGHHAIAAITPGAIASIAGLDVQVSAVTAALDIVPGTAPVFQASIEGLTVTTPAGVLHPGTIKFPFPSGFDVTNPAALGLSVAEFEQLILAMLVRSLSSAFGTAGLASAVLIGAGASAPGLQSDFPVLSDPAGQGSLFTDPLAAVSAWLNKVATQLSADGSSFLSTAIAWLEGWLSASLPADLNTAPDASSVQGSGTYDDPWVLPFGAGFPASGLLWLEPDGPPSMAPLAGAAIGAASDFDGLLVALQEAERYLGQIPSAALASGLTSLAGHLTSTDGVVPLSSQIPTGGSWTTGTAIGTAHHLQPTDSSAITQILTQIDTWAAPGTNRAVLLLGPAFRDHSDWNNLLNQAEIAHTGSTNANATFNLRVPGVAPASIDLRPVTALADFYTADLQDAGSGDFTGLSAQIGLITARIIALKPGATILLVAHSTAGVAARLYTSANATQVKGLITLGTPHHGAPLTPLTDGVTAEALRKLKHPSRSRKLRSFLDN